MLVKDDTMTQNDSIRLGQVMSALMDPSAASDDGASSPKHTHWKHDILDFLECTKTSSVSSLLQVGAPDNAH